MIRGGGSVTRSGGVTTLRPGPRLIFAVPVSSRRPAAPGPRALGGSGAQLDRVAVARVARGDARASILQATRTMIR
jgi:hypothetical protein